MSKLTAGQANQGRTSPTRLMTFAEQEGLQGFAIGMVVLIPHHDKTRIKGAKCPQLKACGRIYLHDGAEH